MHIPACLAVLVAGVGMVLPAAGEVDVDPAAFDRIAVTVGGWEV